MARRQSAGKGRRGRQWTSEDGNLYASLLLRPGCTPAKAPELSFVAAVAVAETLQRCLAGDGDVRLKWPNDVLLNGKKVCGILLESSAGGQDGHVDFVVVGIGINVAHFPNLPGGVSYGATAITAEWTRETKPPGPDDVFELLAGRMSFWLERWRSAGFAAIRGQWLELAAFLGERIRVSPDFDSMEGIFTGLSASGALILELDDGSETEVPAGDVFPVG